MRPCGVGLHFQMRAMDVFCTFVDLTSTGLFLATSGFCGSFMSAVNYKAVDDALRGLRCHIGGYICITWHLISGSYKARWIKRVLWQPKEASSEP